MLGLRTRRLAMSPGSMAIRGACMTLVAARAVEKEWKRMRSLWHWLKDWGLRHQMLTAQAPPRVSTPIVGIAEEPFLR
jgi:hypothetical protein